MQNSRYVLLGFLLVLFLGGGALYWTTLTPDEQASSGGTLPLTASQQTANEPAPGVSSAPAVQDAPTQPDAPQTDAAASDVAPALNTGAEQSDAKAKEAPEHAAQATETIIPEFDILRVEPDGSLVIAGSAAENSDVDVIAGSKVLGSSKAGPNGDFAIVLDRALSAGDHQLVLRATVADSNVATSSQTAIVSVPENSNGQVLALVEQPGQASRLITRPDPAQESPVAENEDAPEAVASPSQQSANKPESSVATPANVPIAIEAVEIDGQSVFVAGSAQGAKGPGNTVTVKANEIVLGISAVSPEGRFLIQSQQPLAVGDYIIRADLLDRSGRVIATARVPFRRVAGENISAVATTTDQQSKEAGDAVSPSELQKVDGSVIIRRGDNLWTISKRTYGHGLRYTTIYLANRDQIGDPDLIWPGQVFVMPQNPLSDEEVRQQLRAP